MTFRSTRLMNRSRILATSDKTASAVPPTRLNVTPAAGQPCAGGSGGSQPASALYRHRQRVADGLQLWFEQHAADGFIIQGGTPETFPRFVDEVVPLLQARGLFRRDYPGTLRESLGLALPANQFQK